MSFVPTCCNLVWVCWQAPFAAFLALALAFELRSRSRAVAKAKARADRPAR